MNFGTFKATVDAKGNQHLFGTYFACFQHFRYIRITIIK